MKVKHLFTATVVIFLLVSCKNKSETEEAEAIKPVRYAEIGYSGGIKYKTFSGTSRSETETNLSFRTNGLIVKLNVKVGSKVKKGQLLAELDQKDIVLANEQAKASVQGAKIQLETTRSNLERIKELYQVGSASLSDYENAKNSYAASKSAYENAQKTLDIQTSQFEYSRIIAPTDGVISEVKAEINEFAQAGNPILIMSSVGGNMEINVGVPEAYITKLNHGDEVKVNISNLELGGIITEVGYSTASGIATYPVIVKLLKNNENVRPGMPANVTFQFGSESDSKDIIVPVKAVGEDKDGNFVFVIEKIDDKVYKVIKKYIELGSLSNEGFTVHSGLTEGKLVATAGLRTLYDGQKVNLLEDNF